MSRMRSYVYYVNLNFGSAILLDVENERQTALYTHLGKTLRAIRTKRNQTQEQLSRAAGMSRTSLTNIEAGRQKSPLHELLKLADALDIELRELIPLKVDLPGEVSVLLSNQPRRVGNKTAALLERLKKTE